MDRGGEIIMLSCVCGKKYVSQAKLDAHLEKGLHNQPVPSVEPIIEEVKPTGNISLKFIKAVEISINGKHYDGQEIVAPDLATASELIRIAREAYGSDIL